MRARRADPALARRQAAWIATLEPWRGLGYTQQGMGRWLARVAGAGQVRVAGDGDALIVVQPEVLLGDFIALLAVRPEAAGRGLGRALVEETAQRAWKRRRWLYTSSDAGNTAAGRFYRKLGFEKVGRLPDLIRAGSTEVLWRLPRPPEG